jgi:hypothetical protein
MHRKHRALRVRIETDRNLRRLVLKMSAVPNAIRSPDGSPCIGVLAKIALAAVGVGALHVAILAAGDIFL